MFRQAYDTEDLSVGLQNASADKLLNESYSTVVEKRHPLVQAFRGELAAFDRRITLRHADKVDIVPGDVRSHFLRSCINIADKAQIGLDEYDFSTWFELLDDLDLVLEVAATTSCHDCTGSWNMLDEGMQSRQTNSVRSSREDTRHAVVSLGQGIVGGPRGK